MVTMCPFFCSIMPGRNAFSVQKWASVLTEKVLTSRRHQAHRGNLRVRHNSLLDILGGQVNKKLALYYTSVVDEDRRVPNLYHGQ